LKLAETIFIVLPHSYINLFFDSLISKIDRSLIDKPHHVTPKWNYESIYYSLYTFIDTLYISIQIQAIYHCCF